MSHAVGAGEGGGITKSLFVHPQAGRLRRWTGSCGYLLPLDPAQALDVFMLQSVYDVPTR